MLDTPSVLVAGWSLIVAPTGRGTMWLSLVSGRATNASSSTRVSSLSSGKNCWADFNPIGELPDAKRTISGSRFFCRFFILWTPEMFSSLAMALNFPFWSYGKNTFSPSWSMQRRNLVWVFPFTPRTSPTSINVSPLCIIRDLSWMVSMSSLFDTNALIFSRTSTESGKRLASSLTCSIHFTDFPSSLRISKNPSYDSGMASLGPTGTAFLPSLNLTHWAITLDLFPAEASKTFEFRDGLDSVDTPRLK